MYLIQVSWEDIQSRGQKVRELLKPLTNKPDGPAWSPKSTRTSYIIATHDGSPVKSDYREWRFATFVPNFRAMYYEIWNQVNSNYLYLDRSYLSIFQIDCPNREEIEYLCLHCDPNEPDHAPHAAYKKGPHLHIKAAEPPIPHAHIALNRAHLTATLQSIDSLSTAIDFAVEMLKEEILEPLHKIQMN